jgi:hypothetical protein
MYSTTSQHTSDPFQYYPPVYSKVRYYHSSLHFHTFLIFTKTAGSLTYIPLGAVSASSRNKVNADDKNSYDLTTQHNARSVPNVSSPVELS